MPVQIPRSAVVDASSIAGSAKARPAAICDRGILQGGLAPMGFLSLTLMCMLANTSALKQSPGKLELLASSRQTFFSACGAVFVMIQASLYCKKVFRICSHVF